MKTRHLFALLAFAILLWEPTRVRGQAPTNDEPCGAFVLTPQGVICTAPTVGTTQGATETPPNGYQNTAQCGQGQVVPALDVWYQFTPGNSQLPFGATITVTGNAAGRIRLFSAPSCSGPFTEIGCSSAAAPNTTAPALVTSPTALAIPNVIFYVAVTAYGGAGPGGPFTICVTDGPGFVPCPNPAVGTPVYTSPAHTTATFSFVPGVNNVGPFTVFLRVTSSSTIVQSFPVTAPGFTISGLVPGTDYTLGVEGFVQPGE